MVFENGVKNIQAPAYNSACTVIENGLHMDIFQNIFFQTSLSQKYYFSSILRNQLSCLLIRYPMRLHKTLGELKKSENVEISRPDFLEGNTESECESIPDQQSSYSLRSLTSSISGKFKIAKSSFYYKKCHSDAIFDPQLDEERTQINVTISGYEILEREQSFTVSQSA